MEIDAGTCEKTQIPKQKVSGGRGTYVILSTCCTKRTACGWRTTLITQHTPISDPKFSASTNDVTRHENKNYSHRHHTPCTVTTARTNLDAGSTRSGSITAFHYTPSSTSTDRREIHSTLMADEAVSESPFKKPQPLQI